MKAWDIVGYAYDGTVYCPRHASLTWPTEILDGTIESEVGPIFADETWDYVPSCDTCGDELEVSCLE